jgi:uncharacterized protein (DUF697 family)
VPTSTAWNAGQELLNRAHRGEFDHASEETRAQAVSELIQGCSSAAAVLALQPFTGVDSALVTPIHYRMVEGIARIRGHVVDALAIYRDILRPLRDKVLFDHFAMMGLKFVPFTNILAIPVAYGLTCALGAVSAEYYGRDRAMDRREMRSLFDAVYKRANRRAYKEKRNELRAMFRSPAIRQRIDELKKARREGTLRPEEVERRIDELLGTPFETGEVRRSGTGGTVRAPMVASPRARETPTSRG